MTPSVMITTKNRAMDLRRTCRALQELNPPPLEVLTSMLRNRSRGAEMERVERNMKDRTR